jgi:hypothetical protein
MKTLILVILALALSSCGKNGSPTDPVVAPVADLTCEVYDSCSYGGGFARTPIYNCTEKTLQMADHPEISAQFFNKKTCLTTKEDFYSQRSVCGMSICVTNIQGPGPLAIPALNL